MYGRKTLIILALLRLVICPAAFAQIKYTDRAQSLGIDTRKELHSIGNGVSFRDFNDDGLDDLTIGTEMGQQIDFYQNDGDRFTKLTPLVNNVDEVKQILWVDFDNDGDQDLYIATAEAPNYLFENTGALNLVDITEASGLPLQPNTSYGAIWGDYNRDGHLDLYFSDRKLGNPYDQTSEAHNQNQLYLNNGDQTLSKVTINSRSADAFKIPFASAFLDYNNDHWPDIYTANDKLVTNTLLQNDRECGFLDVGAQAGANVKMNAMCVAVGDYNNDGWQDIYVTNTPVGNKLLMNEPGKEYFTDATEMTGTGYYGNGWGSIFLDGDNDGYLDLYVSGSMVGADAISNVFYRNLGNGQFDQPDMGFQGDTTSSYANAYGDFNQDGYPDIIVQNNTPFHAQLWQNSGSENAWLKLRLQGVVSNRDATGTLVHLYANGNLQTRYTHCGIGYLGQNSKDVMFGLGEYDQADSLHVYWSSGHIDKFYHVAASQTYKVTEGATTPDEASNQLAMHCANSIDAQEPNDEATIPLSVTSAASIHLFPNPVTNTLYLKSAMALHSVQVYDLSGRHIWKGKPAVNSIDVSTLNKGTYQLILRTVSGRTISRTFIKHDGR